jgi:uncharacterized protein (TIGR03067 family)
MHAVTFLALALPLAAPALKDPKEPPIAGKWVAVRWVTNGVEDRNLGSVHYVFTGDGKWAVLRDGQPVGSPGRSYVLDKRDPAAIDLVFQQDWKEGGKYLAIFEVKDDRLTICLANENQPRPTLLESNRGARHSLILFKKVAKPK